jgi:hypothetical protein
MPFWGWVLLIAGLSGLLVASVYSIVRFTHRLPRRTTLHTDPADIVDPVPLRTAQADSMTARELEEERANDRAGAAVTRDW